MSQITLNTPVEVAPAVAAITSNHIIVLEVRENYGWEYDPAQPGGFFGPGRPQTVEATVLLDKERGIQRTLTVWEGDAYLAIRGTWTDSDLAARITTLLGG
jgi:hypothetical protein